MTIVLVGITASGKTTVGQRLARLLEVPFRDSDDIVSARTGKILREIFVDDGEEAFRALEEAAVREALPHGGVLALGSGAVLSAPIRAALAGHTVVWLELSVATATRRAGMAALGPRLLGDVRKQLQDLLDQRTPLYTQVATYRVDANRRPAEDLAAEIQRLVQTSAEVAT